MSVKKQTVGVPVFGLGVFPVASSSAMSILAFPVAKACYFETEERLAQRSEGPRPSTVKVEMDRPCPGI